MIRAIAAMLALATLALIPVPARAKAREYLIVPLTGKRVRTIRAETLFHTLFADFHDEPDGTTFVETGDIPAMWLRDSSAQALPYIRFSAAFPILAARLEGVVERNARNLIADPYANGFDERYRVWERKWEAGSPAWPIMLAWTYWKTTGYRSVFTPALHAAMRKSVDTWRCEQLHARCSRYSNPQPLYTNEAFNGNTGMVWSAFRPSDDPVAYRFNIPQQIVVVIALQEIARLAIEGYNDQNLSNQASSMAREVASGVLQYGRAWNPVSGGLTYVYETDGLGHDLYQDEANIPNLTSMPYLGWCSAYDPVYLNTREFALSKRNRWFFTGTYASGLGSPHTPYGFVWPLGIMARALTATSSLETAASVTTLAETDSEQGLIHESFDPNAYWVYTRAYFGWGNALYAELLFRSIAGFSSTQFPPYSGAAVAFEPVSSTPALTNTSVQLLNTSILYETLADLLQEAGGRATISRVRTVMQTEHGKHPALQWKELEDSHEPLLYAPNLR